MAGRPACHSTVIVRRSHAVVASVSKEIADSLQLARCDCFDASWRLCDGDGNESHLIHHYEDMPGIFGALTDCSFGCTAQSYASETEAGTHKREFA